jgi:flagellar hook-associated protein 3 FlgL
MIINRFLHNLNGNNSKMNKIQMQVGANKRVLRLSDDPVGITKILTSRSRIADVHQYERNIRDAESLLTSSEAAMEDINRTLARLRELAVAMANETVTAEDRKATANEIVQLRDHIFSSLNTSISGRFLFGGHNVTSQPYTRHDRLWDGITFNAEGRAIDENENLVFEDRIITDADGNLIRVEDAIEWDAGGGMVMRDGRVSGTYRQDIWLNRVDVRTDPDIPIDRNDPSTFETIQGINLNHSAFDKARNEASSLEEDAAWEAFDEQRRQSLQFMLGYSVDIPVNTLGLDLSGFGSGNMWSTIDDFYRAMNADVMVSQEDARFFIREMQRLQDVTLAAMADIGGRSNRLELIMERYSIDKINYEQMLTDVEGLDLAEAITRLSFAEATYRASLGIGGRILQPTLLDFLR